MPNISAPGAGSPGDPAARSNVQPHSAPSTAGAPSSPEVLWHAQQPTGQLLGPWTKKELDHAVQIGQVTAATQLWSEGWEKWYGAHEFYPQLAASSPPAGAPPVMAPPMLAPPAHAPPVYAPQPYIMPLDLLSQVGGMHPPAPRPTGGYPSYGGFPAPARAKAKPKKPTYAHWPIKVPGGLLATFGMLNVLQQIVLLIYRFFGVGSVFQTANDLNYSAYADGFVFGWFLAIVLHFVGIAVGAGMIDAGRAMLALDDHGRAQRCALLALTPCTCFLWPLTLPIGIWALIVLNIEGYKRLFKERDE